MYRCIIQNQIVYDKKDSIGFAFILKKNIKKKKELEKDRNER